MARRLACAGANVLLVDAGCAVSAVVGTHLRNLPACRTDPGLYRALARSLLRPLSSAGSARGLPGLRITPVAGGMGALWNCVVPRFHAQRERWSAVPASEWQSLYVEAEQLLGADPQFGAGSTRQQAMLDALADRFGAAAAAPAPIAAHSAAPGGPKWTGAAEVLDPAHQDHNGRLRVLAQHTVRLLHHRSGRVTGAQAVDATSGQSVELSASAFVVAAGALAGPALLWASGVHAEDGSDSAIGRYLTDHPIAFGRVLIDTPDTPANDPEACVMMPLSADRAIHGVASCDLEGDEGLAGLLDTRRVASLYWYPLIGQHRENRIRFEEHGTDSLGLPVLSFEYRLREDERTALAGAVEDLRAAGNALGRFLPAAPPQALAAGSSMHLLGTTRLGERDDGSSVADAHGRAWRFENLYVAGTGAIPTASATNPTLTACALAVRTARHILAS